MAQQRSMIEDTSRTNYVIQPGETPEQAKARNDAYYALKDAGYSDADAYAQASADPAAAMATAQMVVADRAHATQVQNTSAYGTTWSQPGVYDPATGTVQVNNQMRDQRDYMLGRDPNYAANASAAAYSIADRGAEQQRQLGDALVTYGLPASQAAAQQAIDAGATARQNAQGIQGRGDELSQYGVGQAQALTQTGQNLAALGGQYSAGLQQTGNAAAQYGAAAGQAATAQGQRAAQDVTGAGVVGYNAGQAGLHDLARAGLGAAQATTTMGQGVQQAGMSAAGVGSQRANEVAGAGESAAFQGQLANQRITSAGGAARSALEAQAGSRAADATWAQGRQSVETDFSEANQALGRAAGTAAGTQQQLGATGEDLAARAYSSAAGLADIERTEGPSAAQAQLRMGTSRAINQQLSQAKGGRGLSGSASAMDNAGRNIAGIQSDLANQSAILRSNEEAARRTRQASNLASAGQIQLGTGQALGQMQTAGGQLATQAQLAQASQLGNQAQYGTSSAVQQQALRDQTMTNLYGQSLAAQQAGSQLGLQGQIAGSNAALQGAGVNVQGQQAASQAALQGAGMNLQGATAAAQLGQAGQQMNLAALQAGQGMALQGAGLNLQGASTGGQLGLQGTQMGINAAQQGLSQQLAAQQAAAQYGIGAAQYGAGLQATGAQLGVNAAAQGAGLYAQGAQYGSANDLASQQAYLNAAGYGTGLIGQQAGLYGNATQMGLQGVQTVLGINQAALQGSLAREDNITREDAIIAGQLAAEAAARNQLIGTGVQAGAIGLGYMTGGPGGAAVGAGASQNAGSYDYGI